MKVLIGGIIQESNTFSPVRSTMNDFRRHHFATGEDLLAMKTENELKGFLRAAAEEGAQVVPTLSANAVSSGVFTKEALAELAETLDDLLGKAGGCDGAYFALHGAMVAEGCDDVEGFLIERIRNRIGAEIPLVISLDLHGNVTRKMVDGVNGIVGFRTYPHVDFAPTGYRSAKLLFSMVRTGRKPSVQLRKIPMIVPAENSQSTHGPFADLWKEAEEGERRGDSLVTSLFPVQPWLDIEEMGTSVVVVGENAEAVAREADRLADLFWQKRSEFNVRLYSVREIVKMAEGRKEGDPPFIVSDSADSPGAGATGDSNAVLKQLLDLGVHHRLRCLLTVVDAPAVAQAVESGVGSRVTLRVGYTLNPNRSHGSPMEVTGVVRRIGDGKFYLGGGYAKNTEANMGRCVVLEIGTLSLLISEKPTFSGDPGMYRSMGLEPAQADIVMVKSANQFRADYEKLSNRMFILDTPGVSPANIKTLTYRKLNRPFYPFDDHFNWRERP